MKRVLFLTLCTATLMACTPDMVPVDTTLADDTIEVWAQALTTQATLRIEVLERQSEMGLHGWHIEDEESFQDEVSFVSNPEELQDILNDRGYNVIVEGVQCLRWMVNYDNGRHICEGNGDSAQLTTETGATLFGQELDVWTWSDPGGAGCSAAACLDN